MIASFLQVFAVFTTSFVVPFAGAAEPFNTTLPQDVSYANYISSNLGDAEFSTDVTRPLTPRVAAVGDVAELQAFIISPRVCVDQGDTPTYRLLVRNVSNRILPNITVRFHYPDGTRFVSGQPAPTRLLPAEQAVEWYVPSLPIGGALTFTAQIEVSEPIQSVTVDLLVSYDEAPAKVVMTSHTINGACGTYDGPTEPLPANKQPAIICDPTEAGCVPGAPPLGPNFQNAFNPAQQPIICAPNDPRGCIPNLPQLGPRFIEAIADIIPGECRVLEDNIIADPFFHDAFNRRAQPAAAFIKPLYNSGQDFLRLTHENELLGITNKVAAKEILQKIHTKHWEKQIKPLNEVLEGTRTTSDIRSKIDPWLQEWVDETREAQRGLKTTYEQLQQNRKTKFDPIAQQAIANAREAIGNACGALGGDGGLALLLPPVKQAYDATLDQQILAYDITQNNFSNPNSNLVDAEHRAATWQADLRAALDAFDRNNRAPLEAYIKSIPLRDQRGFAAAWEVTYTLHATNDEAADNLVRLQRWEVALDTPKSIATNCEKENVFGAPIETTWCESGNVPEVIIQGAPNPAKIGAIRPPEPILNGELAQILFSNVTNTSCQSKPGDPFWSADCSCSCNQLLELPRDVNIRFCQNEEGSALPITRHDMYVTTKEECLTLELQKHADPFF